MILFTIPQWEMSVQSYQLKTTVTTMDLPNTGEYDKTEKAKTPEKRVRRFQPHWQDTYSWVYFDESVGKMFCRICKDNPDVADPASAYFTGGCCNFQIMSLQSHAKSKGHINAEDVTRMKAGGVDNVQTWNRDLTPDASSPSSSSGPALSLHQFTHPLHLFTNTTGSVNYKTASDLLNEGLRAMSKRTLGSVELNPDGPVLFRDIEHGSFTAVPQGGKKLLMRASSTHENSDAVESSAESQVTISQSHSHRLRCMFLNAYAVTKMGRSPEDYTRMCELDVAKGLEVDGDHTPQECLSIQEVMAQSERVKLRNAVERCKYFSVICDLYRGKTADLLVFYIKTTEKGKQRFYVLNVEKRYAVKSECCAKILQEALEHELDGLLWEQKLVGILHDLDMQWEHVSQLKLNPEDTRTHTQTSVTETSASVRIKTEPGVEISPCSSSSKKLHTSDTIISCVLSHRCLIHRIQLFVADTIQPLPYDRRVEELLRVVRQRCRELYPSSDEGSEDVVCSDKNQWLKDRLEDVIVFNKNYSQIVELLIMKNREDTSFSQWIEFCKTQRFVKYIHFLSDLLGVLDNSFKTLSDSNATIGEVYESVSDAIDNVKKLQKRSGQQLVKVEKDPDFQGYFLSSDDVDGFETDRAFILTSVVADLAPRLCDLQEDKMAAMAKLTCLQQWPVETEDLKDYADEDVLMIVETYSDILLKSGVDTDKCLMEWSQLKNHIRRRFSSPDNASWESIIPTCKGKCENILSLLTFILTLPGQSAVVEKGYQYLENMEKRGKMKPEEIRNQLSIYLSFPDISQFDPEPYMEKWSEPATQDGSPPRKRSRKVSREDDEAAYPDYDCRTEKVDVETGPGGPVCTPSLVLRQLYVFGRIRTERTITGFDYATLEFRGSNSWIPRECVQLFGEYPPFFTRCARFRSTSQLRPQPYDLSENVNLSVAFDCRSTKIDLETEPYGPVYNSIVVQRQSLLIDRVVVCPLCVNPLVNMNASNKDRKPV